MDWENLGKKMISLGAPLLGTALAGPAGAAIGMIPLLIGAFTTLFGIPGAILGITAWGRNKLKQAKEPTAAVRTLVEN